MSDISKVSDGTGVVVKCLRNILIPCFEAGVCGNRENTPNHALFFVRKKYTIFSTDRIVALRSVNKIFPERATISQLTTYGSMIVCNYELDHCNGHRTCETPKSNETLEIPVLSTCLSVVYPDLKTARMWSRPLHIEY